MQTDSAAWLQARSKGLGGSDIAAIVTNLMRPEDRIGCYRKSLIAVWATKAPDGQSAKVDPVEAQTNKKEAERGHILEDYVSKLFEADTGFVTTKAGLTWHGEYKHVFGNIDRLILGGDSGLEIKTRRSSRGWGRDGSSQVPVDVDVQCRVYMEVFNLAKMYVCVAFGLDDIRTYTIERDVDVGRRIMQLAELWWTRHVDGGEMPEIDSADETATILKFLGRGPDKTARDPDDEDNALLANYREASLKVKEATAEKNLIRNKIQARLTEHDEISGVASWLTVTKKDTFDMVALESAHPEIVAPFKLTPKPHRRLRIAGERVE